MVKMLLRLTDEKAHRSSVVGGKGAGLHNLLASGLPTPCGLVLTADAHQEFLDSMGGGSPRFQSLPEAARGSERARKRLVDAHGVDPLPASVSAALESVTENFNGRFEAGLAVRSSATDEDSSCASAAGLHRTHLGVSPDRIEEAVRDCWASLWSDSASNYHVTEGSIAGAMAVVFQPIISAVTSAVVFTQDPSGANRYLRVEAAQGLGDALVSGRTLVDSYVVDRISLGIEELTPQAAGDCSAEPLLSEAQIYELTELALRAERAFGHALDMEVAFDTQGWIWFTQARPITTPLGRPGACE